MAMILFLIAFFASTVGSITGIGGGIVVKPLIDALGLLEVSVLSFLSGCMVLAMALISLWRSRRAGTEIYFGKMVWLALGAAAGGVIGKQVFQWIQKNAAKPGALGLYQNIVLLLVTVLAFFYTLRKKNIRTYQLKGNISKTLCGLTLGTLSAFLGIGGGPINLMALSFFFSMDSKNAAIHSLFIIVVSQMVSLGVTAVSGTIPVFDPMQLALMVVGGAGGAVLGSYLVRKMSLGGVDRVFLLMLVLIAATCLVSIIRFSGAM